MNAFFNFVGECALLVADAFSRIFRGRWETAETVNQMSFVGVSSIPIVALATFFSGSVLALYVTEVLVRYGATSLAGATIGLSAAREIAPVLAGIMVAARCGSAMAAQIGSMKVTEQIDAMKALSVHPTDYLVNPRLWAGVTMVPVLSLIGVYSAIAGGYLVAISRGVASGAFINSLQQFVKPWDFWGGIIKAIVFGIIVSVVACQQGMQTTGGAVGVGQSTTRTVVISMVLIYVANFILASLLY
ncbi:MAG: ABC transporter permease [Armatimonadetes bacterium]|nr:ABC transporter permease [Armatimonadota bacterium]